MNYYSKVFLNIAIIINIIAGVSAIFVALLNYFIAPLGCSLGCPKNYMSQVVFNEFKYLLPILTFLIFSSLIIFLQQYKNFKIGYSAFLLILFDIYIIVTNLPILTLAKGFFSTEGDVNFSIKLLWLFIGLTIVLSALIPFYVLGKVVKHDLLAKK